VLGPAIAFLATFGHTLLSVWIGEGFADAAAAPLRFLALAGLLLALSAAPADVARALARPSWVTVYTAAGAVIAVGGSLLLVGDHGAAGVAAALFAALLLSTVPFTLVVSRLLLDTHTTVLASALARPLVAVAACAGLFLAGDALTSGIGPALAIGITVTVAYGAGVLRLVASDRERSVLRTMVRRGAPA
jgi:O-antigen/teichoic acid export membrane protein